MIWTCDSDTKTSRHSRVWHAEEVEIREIQERVAMIARAENVSHKVLFLHFVHLIRPPFL